MTSAQRPGTAAATGPGRWRGSTLLAATLIVAAALAAYANSLKGDFIWDDQYLIRDNVQVKERMVKNIFTEDFGAGGGQYYGFYRPLQNFASLVGHSLWGSSVVGYHAMSVLFHVLTAILLFLVLRAVFRNEGLSFVTALLWVVHPAHPEAVSYMSGLGDPLGAFFVLSSLLFYVMCTDRYTATRNALSALGFLLGIFTKEGAVVLPALCALYSVVFRKRFDRRLFLSFAAVLASYAFIRIRFVPTVKLTAGLFDSLPSRVPGFFVALVDYARILLFPADLHMEYGSTLFAATHPKAIAGAALFALLAAAAYRFRSNKLIPFAIGWFFIALAPVSNLYPIAFYMADHYLYLPSVGFFLVLAEGLTRHAGKMPIHPAWPTVALAAPLALMTVKQNEYWRDPGTFLLRTLQYSPASVRMQNELGRLYDKMGRYDEAIERYAKAIELNPAYGSAYNNIGAIYIRRQKFAEAIPYFEKAIERMPANPPDVLNNLGVAYTQTGQFTKAIDYYQKAIAAYPRFAGAYANMGKLYLLIKDYDKAEQAQLKAMEFDPYLYGAYENLVAAYAQQGKYEKAVNVLNKALALRLNPGDSYYKLAEVYFRLNDVERAVEFSDLAEREGFKIPPPAAARIAPYRKKR